MALRRIANYYDIPNPQDPRYPEDPVSVTREEFETVLGQLAQAGLPVKPDLEHAWRDFSGWRVNYDRALISLCGLVMAPYAVWSSDRVQDLVLPPIFLGRKK